MNLKFAVAGALASLLAFAEGCSSDGTNGAGPGTVNTAACGHVGQVCCAGQTCAPNSACDGTTCRALDAGALGDDATAEPEGPDGASDAGAVCGIAGQPCCSGQTCAGALGCREGHCQVVPADGTGQACSRNGECPSGVCLPVPGDAGSNGGFQCTSSSECAQVDKGEVCCGAGDGPNPGSGCEPGPCSSDPMRPFQVCSADADCPADETCDILSSSSPHVGLCVTGSSQMGSGVNAGPPSDNSALPASVAPNVCTTSCTSPSDCVAGWTCGALLGQSSNVCQCSASGEACDGKDNDCDGVIDDEPAVDRACARDVGSGYVCRNGSCLCEHMCGPHCADLDTDPNNCGSCGTVCSAAQKCQSGACVCLNGANDCAVVVLASGQSGATGLAVDDANAYWVTVTPVATEPQEPTRRSDATVAETLDASVVAPAGTGAVRSVPKGGGAVSTLASGQAEPVSLAIDATRVYWIDPGTSKVLSVGLDGGALATLASNQSFPAGIAVDHANVYWTIDASRGSVTRVPLAGGTPATLVANQTWPVGIALNATNVYWGNDLVGNGTVGVADLDGGEQRTLASGQATPGAIALDASNVYWLNTGAGTLMKTSLSGGSPVTLASGLTKPTDLVVDGAWVYVTDAGGSASGGRVLKIATAGTSFSTMAAGLDSPSAIAVDSTSVYWANAGAAGGATGTVMKETPK